MRRIHGVEDILLGFEPKDAGSIPAGSVFSNIRFIRLRSRPNHENRIIYEGPSPQGLSQAHRAGSCFEFCSPIRRGGTPSGAAAIIVSEGESCNNPRIISV